MRKSFSLVFVLFTPSPFVRTFGESLCSFVLPFTKAAGWVPSYGTQTECQRLCLKRDLDFAKPHLQNSVVPQQIACKSSGKFRWHLKINKHVTNDDKTWVCLCCGESSPQESIQLYCCSQVSEHRALQSEPFFFLKF